MVNAMLNTELKIFLLAREYKDLMAKIEELTVEENELFTNMLADDSFDSDSDSDIN